MNDLKFVVCYLTVIAVTSLLSSVKATTITNLEDAKNYLKQYGYIGNDSLGDFVTAIINFQEKYYLTIDGQLNNETLELMTKPRCEEGENSFRVISKWNKTHLTWYFPQVLNEGYLKLAKKAFNYWEEKSNLKFSYV